SETLGEKDIRRTVAFEDPMRHQPVRGAFRLHLFRGLAEGQRLGLRKDIGHKHVMVTSKRRERLGKSNEVTRDEAGALVDELIKGMLAVGAGLAPVDGTRVGTHPATVEGHMLAVAL